MAQNKSERDKIAIENLIGFIKIPTISQFGPKNGTYKKAVDYIKNIVEEMGFEAIIYSEIHSEKPILIATIKGNGLEKSLLLNCHYDVVPVAKENWRYDPFEGVISDDRLYGRGSQDMKGVGIQMLESLYRLKQRRDISRTVHFTFTPDEEIGSKDGMKAFVETELFKKLNVGMAIDEGIASVNNDYKLFLDERVPWWIKIEAVGNTGHASLPQNGTAIQQLISFGKKVTEYNKETIRLQNETGLNVGDRTTINITGIDSALDKDFKNKGAHNVIPPIAELSLDIRISPKDPFSKVSSLLQKWIDEVSIEYIDVKNDTKLKIITIQEIVSSNPTPLDSELFKAFTKAMEKKKRRFEVRTFPGATDMRFLRRLNVPAIGFTALANSEILLHDDNENVKLSEFLEGINVLEAVLEEIVC